MSTRAVVSGVIQMSRVPLLTKEGAVVFETAYAIATVLMASGAHGAGAHAACSVLSTLQAPESTVSQPCGSLSTGNIRRIFGRIFGMSYTEWYTIVDSRDHYPPMCRRRLCEESDGLMP
eukprot:1178224-Prorocentrum_minimum.AAC.1